MRNGFIPALATPLDADGNLMEQSYRRQIAAMLDAGAVALLSMGSMGQQAFLRADVCPRVAKAAVEEAAGRVPVYVGAMDNSIGRVRERMAAMEDLALDAFVLTTPYYEIDTPEQVITYFKGAAAATKHQIMLYDLPGVTNFKITYPMVMHMIAEIPNLGGIKSGDLQLLRRLKLTAPPEFKLFFSGLDVFDVAYRWGICSNLDGMVDCTPKNFSRMYQAMERGDYETAAGCLSNVVALRDFLLARDLWPAFSTAMNLLGFDGCFAPDWASPVSGDVEAEIKRELQRIGEL